MKMSHNESNWHEKSFKNTIKSCLSIVYPSVRRFRVSHCAIQKKNLFDLYRASSGMVGQRMLDCIKLGVELCRAKVTMTNTCNLLKLVELDGLPRIGRTLSGRDELV